MEKDTWIKATNNEFKDSRKTAISTRQIFALKTNCENIITHFKARLVARSFTQEEGIDYDDTYAPVIYIEYIRTLIALAIVRNMSIH